MHAPDPLFFLWWFWGGTARGRVMEVNVTPVTCTEAMRAKIAARYTGRHNYITFITQPLPVVFFNSATHPSLAVLASKIHSPRYLLYCLLIPSGIITGSLKNRALCQFASRCRLGWRSVPMEQVVNRVSMRPRKCVHIAFRQRPSSRFVF